MTWTTKARPPFSRYGYIPSSITFKLSNWQLLPPYYLLSLLLTDNSPGLALCHALLLFLLQNLDQKLLTSIGNSPVFELSPMSSCSVKVSRYRLPYISEETLSLWNVVARPSFWGLKFLFLIAITFLLLLDTPFFLSCKLRPFVFISFDRFYIELIGAWTSGSFPGWRQFCICRKAEAFCSGSAEENVSEPCSVVFAEGKAHARIEGAPGMKQEFGYNEFKCRILFEYRSFRNDQDKIVNNERTNRDDKTS